MRSRGFEPPHRVPGQRAIAAGSLGALCLTLITAASHAQETARSVLPFNPPPPAARWIDVPDGRSNLAPQPRFVGDVNGDGFNDFLIRRYHPVRTPFGESALVYGGQDLPPDGAIDRLRHTRFTNGGLIGENTAISLNPYARVGDVDGDGLSDFLIALVHARDKAGVVFLIFGAREYPEGVDLLDDTASGVRRVRFSSGIEKDYLGKSVAGVGDVDGDGVPDLAISSEAVGSGMVCRGPIEVHVVFGAGLSQESEIDLSGPVGGPRLSDHRGSREQPSGVEAQSYGSGMRSHRGGGRRERRRSRRLRRGRFRGHARWKVGRSGLVVYGNREFPRELFIAAPEEFGVEIGGVLVGAEFGSVLAGAGDVDGDGLKDFLVGASVQQTWGAGEAYLFYGSRDWPSRFLADSPEVRSFRLMGTLPPFDSAGHLGTEVSGLGDWNRDGLSDFFDGGSPAERRLRLGGRTGLRDLRLPGPARCGLRPGCRNPGPAGPRTRGSRFAPRIRKTRRNRGDFDGNGEDELLIVDWPYLALPTDDPGRHLDRARNRDRFAGAPAVLGDPERGKRVRRGTGDHQGPGISWRRGGVLRRGAGDHARGGALSENPGRRTVRSLPGVVSVAVRRGGEESVLVDAFTYTPGDSYPDLELDVERLRAAGHRVLVYGDSELIVPDLHWRQFASVRMHDLDRDGRNEIFFLSPAHRFMFLPGGGNFPDAIGVGETELYGTVVLPEPDVAGMGGMLAFPGDLNGDGREDIAIGGGVVIPQVGAPESWPGRVYVLFGRERWEPRVELQREIEEGRAVAIPTARCGLSRVCAPGDLRSGMDSRTLPSPRSSAEATPRPSSSSERGSPRRSCRTSSCVAIPRRSLSGRPSSPGFSATCSRWGVRSISMATAGTTFSSARRTSSAACTCSSEERIPCAGSTRFSS